MNPRPTLDDALALELALTSIRRLAAAALVGALALTSAQAQPVPLPKTAAEVPGPVAGTAMSKEYVQMVGRMAYLWGWPLVNSINRSIAFPRRPSQACSAASSRSHSTGTRC